MMTLSGLLVSMSPLLKEEEEEEEDTSNWSALGELVLNLPGGNQINARAEQSNAAAAR